MDSIQPSSSLAADKNSVEPNELLDSSSSSSTTSASSSSSSSSLSSSSPSLSASSPPIIAQASSFTQDHKSDLRSIKTELFNKLTGSQSQANTTAAGCSATSTQKQNVAETSSVSLNSLNASNSLAGIRRIRSSTTAICDDGQQHSTKTLNPNNNIKQHLCPLDDLKQDPSLFSRVRARWYTNDEVASILTSFASHPEWQTNELQIRPKSGAVLLYSREKVRYRQDGYCWKKRKNGRTTREDHMKLKVQGIECIYGCYVHSAILPTFHRRCYWLLQNPDIVLVHYLNQPPDDQNKLMLTFNSSLLEEETRRSWTNEEIIEEIGSVFGGISQIQQTLNINFPSSSAAALVTSPPLVDITNEEQVLHTGTTTNSIENERMFDPSSIAQLSQITCKSNAMDEQLDTTIVNNHQQQQQFPQDNTSRQHSIESTRVLTDRENLLTTAGNMANSTCTTTNHPDNFINNNSQIGNAIINQHQETTTNLNDSDQIQSNGHKQEQELHSQDDLISMTFDIVNDCNENNENNLHNVQSRELVCYGDYNSSSTNSNTNNGMDDVATINGMSVDRLSNPDGQHSTNGALEQNPCSPVTQIYNKIVDDIETYALPLEPNQFGSNHHHHHPHHHQQHSELVSGVSSLPIQPMQLGDADQHCLSSHQQIQHELQLHNHHQQSQQTIQQTQQQEHEHQHTMFQLNQQFAGHQDVQLPVSDLDCISKDPSMGLSMDLTSCDLFSNDQDHDRSSVQEENNEVVDDDNLLLVDFNLHSSVPEKVNDRQFTVVDSLNTNVGGDCELSSFYGSQRFTPAIGLLSILDYVPNWCNITGGAKVLIVGNWNSLCNIEQHQLTNSIEPKQEHQFRANHSLFHALFDDQLVPATLIQDNVLRCYVPSHEQGFITLKILYKNCIISEQVLFEMRPSCSQTSGQLGASIHDQGNGSKMGEDSTSDHHPAKSNINNTQKNSSSSNQSISASSSSFSSNQQQHIHVASFSALGGDNSRVLTMAENIISAMHKKNNTVASMSTIPTSRIAPNSDGISRTFDWRLANSLDIDSSDCYQRLSDQQRQHSVKSTSRRWTGSRSLSRDSELNSSYTSAINFNCIEHDPYWHKEPISSSGLIIMQPLSVQTDLCQSMQQSTHNPINSIGSQFSTQKRHSSGSSGFPSSYQQFSSAFTPYGQHQQQFHHKLPHQHPQESQNLTETSSSGLGSIMSSLSPSNSSLHSPLSVCAGAQELGNGGRTEDQSPTCSCGRQSSSTPTSADFCEYFQASAKARESFSCLTLNDQEQQELYEAAKIIQKAYRTYRGRKRQASELLSTFSNTSSEEHLTTSESCHSVSFKNDKLINPSQQQQVEHSTQQQGYSFGCVKAPIGGGFQQVDLGANCCQDRQMQAATIIQAYYRRYRQYVHFKRQKVSSSNRSLLTNIGTGSNIGTGLVPNLTVSPACKLEQRSAHQSARLVVDTLPVFIDKATTSHVDRKRFKTAILISGSNNANANNCNQHAN